MSVEILVDSSIWVYAYTKQDATKRERARKTLDDLASTGIGALSTQVLGELFSTIISPRKIGATLPVSEAMRIVQEILDTWPIVDTPPQVVTEAMLGVERHRMSYWDAQIWAVAKLNRLPFIYSEDGPTGAAIDGIRYVNPLAGPPLQLVKESWRAEFGRRRRRVARR